MYIYFFFFALIISYQSFLAHVVSRKIDATLSTSVSTYYVRPYYVLNYAFCNDALNSHPYVFDPYSPLIMNHFYYFR